MQADVFGNLSQYHGVLATLHELASRNSLDDHQVGIARILRFKQNPDLIDAALEYSNRIGTASEILIAEALNVLVSQDLPINTRASAAKALGHLICHHKFDSDSDFDIDRVVETMIHVLARSESPMIKQALFRAVSAARKSASRRKSVSPFRRPTPDRPA